MSQIVGASNALEGALRATFIDAYKVSEAEVAARWASIAWMGLPSDKLTEKYAYPNTPPHAKRWDRGDQMSSDIFDYTQFSVTNVDWAAAVEWHENDEQDDQTRSLVMQAQSAGRLFPVLDERVMYQIITGATNADLLASIPNAPDGVALYSATDGSGAARYGVTGGNIVTGSGVTSVSSLRADIWNAVERFMQFLDTKSVAPILSPAALERGFVFKYNVANDQVVREAIGQALSHSVVSSTGAAVSNSLVERGLKFELHPTPYITDNDMFLFCKDPIVAPLFKQVRQDLREVAADMTNSDKARLTKIKRMQWDARYGYGVGPAYCTVKINN